MASLWHHRSWLELSNESIPMDVTGHKVWFDEAHQQLILMKNNLYTAIPLRFDLPKSAILKFMRNGNILDVKVSKCMKFLAFQKSDTDVDVVDLDLSNEFKVSCKMKRGNLVLRGGAFWIDPTSSNEKSETDTLPSLCVVSRFGIEIYKVSYDDNLVSGCKLSSKIKHTIQGFWTMPEHKIIILLCANSDGGFEMRPYQFNGSAPPTKLGKFIPSSKPNQKDIYLTKLYDNLCCVQVIPASREIHVYRLGRENSPLIKTLELLAHTSIGVSIVDNLICVHNMEGSFTSVYDIYANTTQPCIAPHALYQPLEMLQDKSLQQSISLSSNDNELPVRLVPSSDEIFSAKLEGCVNGFDMGQVEPGAFLVRIGTASMENVAFDRVMSILEMSKRPINLYFCPPGNPSGVDEVDEDLYHKTFKLLNKRRNYGTGWVFLPPHWVLDSRDGSIRAIQLNLDRVPLDGVDLDKTVNSEITEPSFLLRDPRRLFGFLLRRACPPPSNSTIQFLHGDSPKDSKAYGKAILLHYLRTLLMKSDITVVAQAFETMNQFYMKALRERAATSSSGNASPTAGSGTRGSPVSSPRGPPPAPPISGSIAGTSGDVSGRVQGKLDESNGNDASNDTSFTRSPSFSTRDTTSSCTLDAMYQSFLDVGRISLKDIRCYNGTTVVLQIDVFTWVIAPAARAILADKTENQALGEKLCLCITEYIKSLNTYTIPVERYMFELVCCMLVTLEKYQLLYQMMQYRVSTDSERLANLLLEAGSKYLPMYQIALDMFHRIGAHSEVVETLLQQDQLYLACTTLQKYPQAYRKAQDASYTLYISRLLFECACRLSIAAGNTRAFTALLSFFVSVNPQAIAPDHKREKVNGASNKLSPLAYEVDLESIPNELSKMEKWEKICEAFGLPSPGVPLPT